MRITDRRGKKNLDLNILLKNPEGGACADTDGISPKIGDFQSSET